MLICKFKRAFHMKSVCKTLGSLMEECVIKSDANGLTFLSTDASMSTYITVNFNIAGFLQYVSSGTIYLGVSLKGINNVLNSIPNDSPLEILCDSECPDDFIIGSVDKIGVPMRFNMKVLELDLEEVNRPELAYGATVILSSARFQRDMLHLKNVADKTKITVSEGEVTFSAVDADRMNIVLEETDVMASDYDSVKVQCDVPVTQTFGLRYLHQFAKASCVNHFVKLHLDKDNPMFITYEMDTVGTVDFYLSPQIQDRE